MPDREQCRLNKHETLEKTHHSTIVLFILFTNGLDSGRNISIKIFSPILMTKTHTYFCVATIWSSLRMGNIVHLDDVIRPWCLLTRKYLGDLSRYHFAILESAWCLKVPSKKYILNSGTVLYTYQKQTKYELVSYNNPHVINWPVLCQSMTLCYFQREYKMT